MPIVSSKFSPKEHAALIEFAAQQGESISSVLRKACVGEITLLEYDSLKPEHEFENWVNTADDETGIMKENANVIRKILGWDDVQL